MGSLVIWTSPAASVTVIAPSPGIRAGVVEQRQALEAGIQSRDVRTVRKARGTRQRQVVGPEAVAEALLDDGEEIRGVAPRILPSDGTQIEAQVGAEQDQAEQQARAARCNQTRGAIGEVGSDRCGSRAQDHGLDRAANSRTAAADGLSSEPILRSRILKNWLFSEFKRSIPTPITIYVASSIK
ncbi:hypothetical protein ACRBEV_11600 [Methylobacterium phyllosphaerae]